jgi:hypothetical protein
MSLIKKAKGVFLVMLAVYVLSFGSGFLAGKSQVVKFGEIQKSELVEFNRTLEYRVPGYGDLLQAYKDWHRPTLMRLLTKRNAWGLGGLIFFNNFVMGNLTMFVRALTLAPLALYPYGRFVQGVALAQTPAAARTLPLLLSEFGGYFLVITATLCLWAWAIRPRSFDFPSRKEALGSGFKLVGLAWLVSGVFLALGAFLEVRLLLGLLNRG